MKFVNICESDVFLLTKPFVIGGKVEELPTGRHTFVNLYVDCTILYETYNGTLIAAAKLNKQNEVVQTVYTTLSTHIKELHDTTA